MAVDAPADAELNDVDRLVDGARVSPDDRKTRASLGVPAVDVFGDGRSGGELPDVVHLRLRRLSGSLAAGAHRA
jgi:hypothetical protein